MTSPLMTKGIYDILFYFQRFFKVAQVPHEIYIKAFFVAVGYCIFTITLHTIQDIIALFYIECISI